MLDRPENARRERIVAIVQGFLNERSVTQPVTDDDNLHDAGLTSLDMVNMMLAVEAEFDLMIPGMKLIPANFRTISAIDRLVDELDTMPQRKAS